MKPKFSWDSATAGSLTLRITEGEKETVWKIRKNTATSTLVGAFHSIANILESADYFGSQIRAGETMEATEVSYWQDRPMDETAHTVDQAELDALREAASKQALAEKAESFKLENGMFWGANDLDELDLYELGTGDPE